MNKVTLADIKQALLDHRFRDNLPSVAKEDVAKFLQNPNCPSCVVPILRKILKEYPDKLKDYFPDKEIESEEKTILKLAQNHWSVINCNINDLEKKLKQLPPGRKQIEMSRFQDQVTVIINDLDIIY